MPSPVVSLTVIGTVISPGVEVTTGSDTVIPPREGDSTDAVDLFSFTVNACLSIEAGATLCKPKNSVTESINAKLEAPAPNVVAVINNARDADTNARALTRDKRDCFWLLDIVFKYSPD